MLFDCTALFFGLLASVVSHWKPTRLYSFGFARIEMLSGFVNALFLVVIACFILTEAMGRLMDPPDIITDRLLVSICTCTSIQWNPFTVDTIGTHVTVLIVKVSLIQG